VRGIAYQNGYYFIGKSLTLCMKRAKSIVNVMMSSGVYILEEQSKSVHFPLILVFKMFIVYCLSRKVGEIKLY
jgi:hypothetical protein